MPPKINDFGKESLFKDIVEDVAKLTSDIRQPDKFAQIFCEAAKTQKSIDCTLREVVVSLLQKDSGVQQTVTSLVEQVDRSYQRILLGRASFAVWTITILVIEAIIRKFL